MRKGLQSFLIMAERRKKIIRFCLIALLLACSEIISDIPLMQKVDNEIVDQMFSVKGEKELSQDIVVLIEDEAARRIREEIGLVGSREFYAIIIAALDELSARIIALDYLFQDYREADSDSLLVRMTREADNVILGCGFDNVYKSLRDTFRVTPSSSYQDVNVYEQKHILNAKDIFLPFESLFNSTQYIGHINIAIDEYDGRADKIPLFIHYENQRYSAFALAILQKLWNLGNDDLQFEDSKVIINPLNKSVKAIPVSESGQVIINYLGDLSTSSSQVYSLGDTFAALLSALEGRADENLKKIFKEKIVLIGSTIDEDVFPTPFTNKMPGVLIHATVLNNILEQDFLTNLSSFWDWTIRIGLALLLFLMVIQPVTSTKYLWLLVIAILSLGIPFLLFIFAGKISSFIFPAMFSSTTLLFITAIDFREIHNNVINLIKFKDVRIKSVNIVHDGYINLSHYNAGFSPIRKIEIAYEIRNPIENVSIKLMLDSVGLIWEDLNVTLQPDMNSYKKEESEIISDLVLEPMLFESVRKPKKQKLHLEIAIASYVKYRKTLRISLHPRKLWRPYRDDFCEETAYQSLASFVLKSDPIVNKIRDAAIEIADGRAIEFDGYQSGDAFEKLQLIYWVLRFGKDWKNKETRYTIEENFFTKEQAQELSLPANIADSGWCTCIDCALLMAACLERIGLDAIIMILINEQAGSAHAIVGCWRHGSSFTSQGWDQCVFHEIDFLSEYCKEIIWCDSTSFIRKLAFNRCHSMGDKYFAHALAGKQPFKIWFAIDIKAARDMGVMELL